MATRRSVVEIMLAGSLLCSISRRQGCVTISSCRCEISVNAKVVSASSGTARMSRMSRRVNPIEPAPIMAIRIDTIPPTVGCLHLRHYNRLFEETNQMTETSSIPVATSDPINAKILAISEDKIQGFLPDPIGEISRQSGVDVETVVDRIG